MTTAKISVSLDAKLLSQLDSLVEAHLFNSRSQLVQAAIAEKVERLRRSRFAEECAKLDPAEEQTSADEALQGEVEWPPY